MRSNEVEHEQAELPGLPRKRRVEWLKITADGRCVPHLWPDGTKPTLDAMQQAVHGYIELVRLPGIGELFVNEDGRALGLPSNELAAAVVRHAFSVETMLPGPGLIVGDALLMVRT